MYEFNRKSDSEQIKYHQKGREKSWRMRLFPPPHLHPDVFYSASKMAKTTTFCYRTPRSTLRESIWQKLNTFSRITFHALSNETTPVSQLDYESWPFPCQVKPTTVSDELLLWTYRSRTGKRRTIVRSAKRYADLALLAFSAGPISRVRPLPE